jgi:hypothetical protein
MSNEGLSMSWQRVLLERRPDKTFESGTWGCYQQRVCTMAQSIAMISDVNIWTESPTIIHEVSKMAGRQLWERTCL